MVRSLPGVHNFSMKGRHFLYSSVPGPALAPSMHPSAILWRMASLWLKKLLQKPSPVDVSTLSPSMTRSLPGWQSFFSIFWQSSNCLKSSAWACFISMHILTCMRVMSSRLLFEPSGCWCSGSLSGGSGAARAATETAALATCADGASLSRRRCLPGTATPVAVAAACRGPWRAPWARELRHTARNACFVRLHCRAMAPRMRGRSGGQAWPEP
mmetsp:Transcript_57134/g.178957  ORF Transcript_57134/g.178957 Transcript_57134/m.178957 type:complete len:213 (-) Transcript_57134:7-645(-)